MLHLLQIKLQRENTTLLYQALQTAWIGESEAAQVDLRVSLLWWSWGKSAESGMESVWFCADNCAPLGRLSQCADRSASAKV